MKITPKRHLSATTVRLVAGLVLLLTTIFLVYAYAFNKWPFGGSTQGNDSSVNYDSATDEEIEAGESTAEQKAPTDGDDENNETTPDGDTPSTGPPEGEGPQTGDAGTVSITVASQDGQTFMIRTLIITSEKSGACRLTLERDGNVVYNERVETQLVASNSTCRGFDIDTTGLAKGSYRATVTYANTKGSTSTYEDIAIN